MAELLAPAGSPEALDAAFAEGADGVYLGLKHFNARLRSSNFTWAQFEAAVHCARKIGKKVFAAVNTAFEERETERVYQLLAYLNEVGPDGIIVQDFGVLKMAREFFPNLRLHASTQMNIASARAANLLSREGVKRVVLSRELTLEEIRSIRENTNIELEVFVHGALCVCESGLCLFSSYLGGKSANRGLCTQACRRFYAAETDGEGGGYYFSPRDLQAIRFIPELTQIGVTSFKIEGRMKSAEYVGAAVAAYRFVMDHWQEDKAGAFKTAERILSQDFARKKTSYMFGVSLAEKTNKAIPAEKIDGGTFLDPRQTAGTGIYLGQISAVKKIKGAAYAALNSNGYTPSEGDSIRVHRKDDGGRESCKIRSIIADARGVSWITIPEGFKPNDSVYLIQMKNAQKRYPRILPAGLSRFNRRPSGKPISVPKDAVDPAARKNLLPEGLYVQVSTIKDMYIAAAKRPVKVILELNAESIESLLKGEVCPFPKKQTILSLDPFMPECEAAKTEELIQTLSERGFTFWIANNLAHLSMLKAAGARIIAGPWLYTFNSFAVEWLRSRQIYSFVSPFENSRQNLEKTFPRELRGSVFTTIFAYPSLFRMRFTLPESYNFTYFTDRRENAFKTLNSKDGSFVLPEQPFSIIDKTRFLRESGFKRWIIDFSRTAVTKNAYRRIMDAYAAGRPLPETTRFNWKNGFYSPERDEKAEPLAKTRATSAARETSAPRAKNDRGK